MTEPVPTVDGPTVPDEEALAFEVAAVAAVTAGAVAAVSSVLALAAAAWVTGAIGPELGKRLAARLRWTRWTPMGPALERIAVDARDLGQSRAVALLEPGSLEREKGSNAPRAELGSLPDPDRALSDALEQAARLAESLPMTHKRDLDAVRGAANRGVSQAQGHARWTANEGINAGTAAVAQAAGLRLLWVTERNGCLHCLAHAGWAVPVGEHFPAVSFDPVKPGAHPPVPWPPLHPSCRCQIRTYHGPAGRPDPDRSRVDPAARLAAEARRSVVYQWTDYASGRRAAAAARALLESGAGLPASVEKRAAAALRRGRQVDRPK